MARKAKKGPGRPSKFDPMFLPLIERAYWLNYAENEIAEFLSIHADTWTRWKLREDVKAAIQRARDVPDEKVAKALYRRARGWSHKVTKLASHEGVFTDERTLVERYPADTKAAALFLAARRRGQWGKAVEQASGGGVIIDAKFTTDAD